MQNNIIGINFPGHKIILHLKKSPKCLGWTNINMATDAPYLGYILNQDIVRPEKQLPGYSESFVLDSFATALETIQKQDCYKKVESVICQVSRGKDAQLFSEDILDVAAKRVGFKKIKYAFGEKTTDYFKPIKEKFLFINVGTFSRLTPNIFPGELAIPTVAYDLEFVDQSLLVDERYEVKGDLLSGAQVAHPLHLFGLSDDMPSIHPDQYLPYQIEIITRDIR